MRYFLGIDGGGSQTTSWLADETGRILARITTGPSNPYKTGFKTAQRRLVASARAAIREASLSGRVLDGVCAGIAGVDRPAMRQKMEAALRRAVRARCYCLTTDGVTVLESGLGQSPGVIVISGTGSIAYGRDEEGRILRCGGWGAVFDDAGSGYDIGRKAIVAALRSFDGRGPHTRLGGHLCKALKLQNITETVGAALPPHRIAGLFPVVEDAARCGDPVARRLCQEAGRDLAELVGALLERMGGLSQNAPAICAGGVFKASVRVRRSFARHLHQRAPRIRIELLRRAAVEGALDLAKALAEGRQAPSG